MVGLCNSSTTQVIPFFSFLIICILFFFSNFSYSSITSDTKLIPMLTGITQLIEHPIQLKPPCKLHFNKRNFVNLYFVYS